MKTVISAFAAVVLAGLALTACTPTGQKGTPEVASLSSGPGASSAAPSQEQRPRERLDMTDEDRQALRAPLRQCMEQFGLDDTGRVPPGSGRPQPTGEELDKAQKACEQKSPLPPWEKDSTNPEAADFANRVVQCLRAKGVKYVEVLNEPGSPVISYALGGPNNDQSSVTLGLQHVKECEINASKG